MATIHILVLFTKAQDEKAEFHIDQSGFNAYTISD